MLDLANISDDERIVSITKNRWIDYPVASAIIRRFTTLATMPSRSRMPCVLLTGSSGMGKTHIIDKCTRLHPAVFDPVSGMTRMAVAKMQMPPEPILIDFYGRIIAGLGGVVPAHLSALVLRERVESLAKRINLRGLLIDEMHSMLAGTARQQRILLNAIRYLANELDLSIVCSGTKDAEYALMTDQQLADRFEKCELCAWKDDASFGQLLRSLASVLPLRQPFDLSQPQVRKRLIALTSGITGRVVRLVEDAAIYAIISGTETINSASFDDAVADKSLISISQRHERNGK